MYNPGYQHAARSGAMGKRTAVFISGNRGLMSVRAQQELTAL